MSIPTQLTMTQEMKPQDGFDKFVLEDILLIVQNQMTMELIKFWGHNKFSSDKADEVYLIKIMRSVNALLKANALRRNYILVRDKLLKEIENNPEIKSTNIDLLFNEVDAFILIEGFFTQIKTALDLLAQSFKPIYGLEFHTWERKKNASGMKIADQLRNNLGKELKTNATDVAQLIEDNAEEITKIVAHRDDTVHYGKLQKIQGFRYSVSEKRVVAPLILVTDSESAYVDEYMQEVLVFISELVQMIVITTLSNLLPDMQVGKNPDESWGWFTKGEGKLSKKK